MSKILNNIGAFCKDNKSEILMAVGLIAGVVTTVSACVSTVKAVDAIEEHNERLECIDENAEVEGFHQESVDRAKKQVYKHTAWELIKLYAFPTIMAAASVTSILGSYKIVKDEAAVAITIGSTAVAELIEYRKRWAAKVGVEAENDVWNGRKDTEITTEYIDPKTGKKKTKKEHVITYNPINDHGNDIYAREFGPYTSKEWSDNPKKNQASMIGWKLHVQSMVDCSHCSVRELYLCFGFDTTIDPDNPNPFISDGVGWVGQRVFDLLPDEWDYNGRHYIKSEYSSTVDLGIDPKRQELANHDVVRGLRDDPYIIRPNCYDTTPILEFADIYVKKSKREALALDRKVLKAYDQGKHFDV